MRLTNGGIVKTNNICQSQLFRERQSRYASREFFHKMLIDLTIAETIYKNYTWTKIHI